MENQKVDEKKVERLFDSILRYNDSMMIFVENVKADSSYKASLEERVIRENIYQEIKELYEEITGKSLGESNGTKK